MPPLYDNLYQVIPRIDRKYPDNLLTALFFLFDVGGLKINSFRTFFDYYDCYFYNKSSIFYGNTRTSTC